MRDFAHIIEKEMGGGSQHSSRPASTTPTQLPPAPIHKIIRTESVEQRRIYPPPSVPVKPKFPPNITVDDSSQLQDSFEPFGDSSNVAQSQEVSHVAYLAEINRANKEVSSRIEEFERNSAPDTGSKSISVPPLKLSSLQVPGERRPKVEKSKPKYTERRQTTLDQDSFDQWSPPAEEFEKLRRDVVKQQVS